MTLRQLGSLSRIKERREERSRQALQECRAKLAKALEASISAAEREEAFAADLRRHRSGLYASMIGRRLSAGAIERVNHRILELDRQRRRLAAETEAAKDRVRKAQAEAEEARRALAAQSKALRKWRCLSEAVEGRRRRGAGRASEFDLESDFGDRWLSSRAGTSDARDG